MDIAWMAWTWPTAIFFLVVALTLVGMTVWQLLSPSIERVGVLRIPTTRGDRLFISALGTAFICLAWLGIIGPNVWWALVVAALYALAVFRWV
jgi:predicted small integral membrane protein